MYNKKECDKKYRLRHKKEIKEKQREWYCKNKEKVKVKARESAIRNKERVKIKKREWKNKNRENLKAQAREYRYKNRERLKIYWREYPHKKGISKRYNTGVTFLPGYTKMKNAKYEHRLRDAGKLTIQTIQQVYDENIIANGGVLKCIYCNRELTNKEATLEHKQPISRGGINDKENLAIACPHCNYSKGNKTVLEFENLRQRDEIDKIQLPEPAEKKKIEADIIKEKEKNG